MTLLRSSRPPEHGFLSLLPDEASLPMAKLLKRLEAELRHARDFAQHSRNHALNALECDARGLTERAKADRNNAQVDHRMACDRLAAAAQTMTALLQAAALDWRPSLDVVDSGLTPRQLARLCCAMGPDSTAVQD